MRCDRPGREQLKGQDVDQESDTFKLLFMASIETHYPMQRCSFAYFFPLKTLSFQLQGQVFVALEKAFLENLRPRSSSRSPSLSMF